MQGAKRIGVSLGFLVICLLLFELTPMDIWVQNFLFDPVDQQWLWNRDEALSRLMLYDGIKVVLAVFALVLAAALFFGRKSEALTPYRSGLRIVLVSLVLIPACIGGLKSVTNVACPKALTQFGGKLSYVGIFGTPVEANQGTAKQRCFPAGHASGGFALSALPFLFSTRRRQKLAFWVAMTVGWTMGGYKMAIGDHFLSHTVTTMILAMLIVDLVAISDQYLHSKKARLVTGMRYTQPAGVKLLEH